MTTTTDTSFSALAARFTDTLDGDLSRPSPCEGWSGADVVDHVVDTQRDFLARHGLLTTERPTGDPRAKWLLHLGQVEELLDGGAAEQAIDGWFGPSTVGETLSSFYGFDLMVHRWDVGQAVGEDIRFSDAELDAIEASIAQFGDHMYVEGICQPALPVADDADRQERLLALTGRSAATGRSTPPSR